MRLLYADVCHDAPLLTCNLVEACHLCHNLVEVAWDNWTIDATSYRERFVEYSTSGRVTVQRFSNSGLVWETGQAYIKGLCIIRRRFHEL